MITNKQKLYLCYFLTRASFLGVGYSYILKRSSKDAWLTTILGLIIGYFIVLTFKKILDYKEGKNLNEIFGHKLSDYILKLFIIIFALYIIFQLHFILQTFLTSFFLILTPPWFIVFPFLLILCFIVTKGIKNIAKVSESLFWISVIFPIIIFMVLYSNIDFKHFLPIYTLKTTNLLYSSFIFATLTSVPNIFLLNIKNNGKNITKMYMYSAFSIILMFTLIIGVFGPALATSYRYPEYMILKRIKALGFIEKVENIISIVWLLDGFFLVSMAARCIYDLLPKKYNNKIGVLLVILIFYLTSFFVGKNYILRLKLYYITPLIYIISFILIGIPLLFKAKKLSKN